MPSLSRVTTGPTQSIKICTCFSPRRFHNSALCHVVFPLSLCWHQPHLNERILPKEMHKSFQCPRVAFADFCPFRLYLTKFLSCKVQQASQHLQPQPLRARARVCVCVWEREREKIKSCIFAVLLVNPSILDHTLHHPFHLSKDWCVACMENKHVFQMYVSNATQGLDPGVYFIYTLCTIFYCVYKHWQFLVHLCSTHAGLEWAGSNQTQCHSAVFCLFIFLIHSDIFHG